MQTINHFDINDYITLKLEKKKTVIYIGGKRFIQCIGLTLDIEASDTKDYDSIDEIIDIHNEDPSYNTSISIGDEFWGHCSNLQAWVEQNYDTRLLHQNLAFPILKRLTELGDPQARKVFKEEIAKRIQSKRAAVILYLQEEGYVNYLSREEFWSLFSSEVFILVDIEKIIRSFEPSHYFELYPADTPDYFDPIPKSKPTLRFKEVDDKIIGVSFNKLKTVDQQSWNKILEILSKLNHLEYLFITECNLCEIPKFLCKIRSLKEVDLQQNYINSLPKDILDLESLEYLILSDNGLKEIPNFLNKLNNLRRVEI
ncbi:MAG: leucine-rich repeat domain-containing protein [Candidatus Thorarchaeota archaeon]